jgi:hypothetical protein
MTVPDVLTIGRVSVDLCTEQAGVPPREATTFRKSIGGTSTNAAGAIVAGRMMCADDMPTPHDIDALLHVQRAGGIVT